MSKNILRYNDTQSKSVADLGNRTLCR